MAIEVVTKEDLQEFRIKLLDDIRRLVIPPRTKPANPWLKNAEVIMNITGNVIREQVTGDTQFSERFGKIMQDRSSLSINTNDTSLSKSKQLESAIQPSAIAALSSGEFVGMVADNPDQKIELKAFHYEIINKHPYLLHSEYCSGLPITRQLDANMVNNNYARIKTEVQQIIEGEIERMLNNPGLEHSIIKKD